ncbi:MAG: flavin reductase family protein [Parvibaculum sp.]|uniref:flavin reductase family protein n=1 Tax=Parvibaculum sp. TaxID=2024848 RepID=UPI0025F6418E|nr:flavin reductase family protein [Parvibaculum sp.]MCE9649518.1 flavin reductase family protein [Parvibaculum sp.]
MFYEAETNKHGLKHDPFKALVVPRPIGWISTLDLNGVSNLAPYSFFNAVSTDPHIVMFSSAGRKDSQRNAEETGEFVCNLAGWEQREKMNMSSSTVGPEVDEFVLSGLATEPSRMVKPLRVEGAPAHLECVYLKTIELVGRDGRHSYDMVLGEVVGIHIDDRFIADGMVDSAAMKPVSRLGYMDYAVVDEIFTMKRPR